MINLYFHCNGRKEHYHNYFLKFILFCPCKDLNYNKHLRSTDTYNAGTSYERFQDVSEQRTRIDVDGNCRLSMESDISTSILILTAKWHYRQHAAYKR
jgi:hypothetical protein